MHSPMLMLTYKQAELAYQITKCPHVLETLLLKNLV